MRRILTLASLLGLVAACESSTVPGEPREVSVRFQAVEPGGASSSLAGQSPFGRPSFNHVAGTSPITIAGSNGTLVIEDIRVVVSEIELKPAGAECHHEDDHPDDDDDACQDFEGGPFLVSLLDGSAAEVVTAIVPAGLYSAFEFEVEDLDVDGEDDEDVRSELQSILAELRGTTGNPGPYPAFPSEASMVVHGTFDGEPFTVYFAAEIEVEQEFATPFRVPEDGAIIVNFHPALWFSTGGVVLDLHALDGQTVEIDIDFQSGVEVEHDDHHHDD